MSITIKEQGRLQTFDFAKGLLIIMVVWGHFCAHSSGLDYEKNLFTSYIRLFQMPMFILISGFFQKEVISFFDFSKRIKKTMVHIGLPLIVWALIATLVLYLLNAFGIYELQDEGINRFVITLYKNIRFYWFLPCLILCIVFNATINYISNILKIKALLLYIVSILLLLLIPRDLFHFQFMWPFFLLGICLRRYSQKGLISSLLRGETSTSQKIVLLTILGGGHILWFVLAY